MIVGAGEEPCVVLAIGAQEHQTPDGWGAYVVDEAALRHGVGVDEETSDPAVVYSPFPDPVSTRYGGWLPG